MSAPKKLQTRSRLANLRTWCLFYWVAEIRSFNFRCFLRMPQMLKCAKWLNGIKYGKGFTVSHSFTLAPAHSVMQRQYTQQTYLEDSLTMNDPHWPQYLSAMTSKTCCTCTGIGKLLLRLRCTTPRSDPNPTPGGTCRKRKNKRIRNLTGLHKGKGALSKFKINTGKLIPPNSASSRRHRGVTGARCKIAQSKAHSARLLNKFQASSPGRATARKTQEPWPQKNATNSFPTNQWVRPGYSTDTAVSHYCKC